MSKILVDERFLSSDYLPEKLVFRETEFNQLVSNIKNFINTLIIGPVGSGKTTLVKLVKEHLKKQIEIIYIDCAIYDTQYAVLREILPSSKLIVYKSVYELVKELADLVSKKKFFICFDNFVRLKEQEMIRKAVSLGVNVILIGNIERDAAILNENILSNMPSFMKLKSYSIEKTLEIIRTRSEKALAQSTYTDDTLKQVAEKAKGNITRALGILKFAALQAQVEGKNSLDELDTKNMFDDPVDLNEDQETLLRILENKKNSSSGELFKTYQNAIRFPKGDRCFRKYMQKLCSLNLVRTIGRNSGRVYELADASNIKRTSI
ncbi:MAG: AAA family ATPase [archaeon]|nr:AAA family ATPase [archaeon]